MDPKELDSEALMTETSADDSNGTLMSALHAQMRQTTWYMGSIGFHVILFGILLLLPQTEQRTRRPARIITHSVEETVEMELEEIDPDEPEEMETDNIDPLETPDLVQTQATVMEPTNLESLIEEESQEEESALNEEELGAVDVESDSEPILGLSSNFGALPKGAFSARGAGLQRDLAMLRNGGDKMTAKAVEDGLKWLAAHQHSSGCWRAQDLGIHGALNVSITSVALLAFLGNGNSTECGRYRANVKRAVNWLIRQKSEDGLLGRHSEMGVTLMAMSEAYAMSQDTRLKTAATRFARYCAKTQFNCGGWDYSTTPFQVNLLVSGWYVLGLKSARMAGIPLPNKTWENAQTFFYQATSGGGTTFNYIPIKEDTTPKQISPRHDRRNVAMNLACMHFLGFPKEEKKIHAAANMTINYLPNPEHTGGIDYNYLYYQGLGLFQMGARTEYWQNYNKPMKSMLLDLQVKDGSYRELRGSWPPTRNDATNWGRVGSTAMACLTLQIYYLY